MSAKRLAASALVALAALSVQTVCAAPVRSTQVARALRCCSPRCDHARSSGTARDCCVVDAAGPELTAPPVRTSAQRPVVHATPVALATAGPATVVAAAGVTHDVPRRARGAPLFIVSHSLRL